ncbi:MAG: hypothetical protein HRT37_13770 [Alteromonadaceae bacterium]|nr:hypothetical protein [Alteromonadaceae bacterium]
MTTWQEIVVKGNSSVEKHKWQSAEQHYKEAIHILEGLLSNNPKCVESIQGWICSYHNLSILFQQTGKIEQAQKCLLIPHHSMMYMAKKEKTDEDQHLIAMGAIKLTINPLLEFAKKYPTCESCFNKLKSQYQQIHNDGCTYH